MFPNSASHLSSAPAPVAAVIAHIPPNNPQFATAVVDALLESARDAGASDIHLTPSGDGLNLSWRLDGVLQPLMQLPAEITPNIIARLKVLAGLLTYETSLPQEGRIRHNANAIEVRMCSFPSLYGERAVLRFLGEGNGPLATLAELGLPTAAVELLKRELAATAGAILIVGPAGSGKTTTAYACLRQVATNSQGGRSIATLEDPIEVAVPNVAQSQVNLPAGFDMATGLRSLLRLDPEVILIGEIRDQSTAGTALQAALTGQLVISTFHAGSCDEAISRLAELGMPGYAIRKAVRLIVAQRLVRKLCNCAIEGDPGDQARSMGLRVKSCRIAVGCDTCHHTGYCGRTLITEWRTSVDHSTALSNPAGVGGLWNDAIKLVETGITSAGEIIRVLGFGPPLSAIESTPNSKNLFPVAKKQNRAL